MYQRQKIAYLGGPGSYSHIGCTMRFPEADHLPYETFSGAFAAVQSGECDLGLVPLENTIAGRVADVHQLLPKSGLYITGELFVPIEHCLLAPQGATLTSLREVHSHIHALGQCRAFISRHALKACAASDTSSAARLVAMTANPELAAIANSSAAALYGLEILSMNVQDHEKNITRFVVLSREHGAGSDDFNHPITTMTFDLGENPAQLHKALGGFAENAINITRVESCASRGISTASFMIDFEGAPQDIRVRRTFSELSKYVREFRLLGTYESSKNVAL